MKLTKYRDKILELTQQSVFKILCYAMVEALNKLLLIRRNSILIKRLILTRTNYLLKRQLMTSIKKREKYIQEQYLGKKFK